MAQPQWITPAGSLGTIPEGIFYQVSISAQDPDGNQVYYRLIAGQLPDGIQVTTNGVLEGTPKPILSVQGVPAEVSRNVTSTFAIRAYTQRVVNGVIIIDRVSDRTFNLTVTGQDLPQFVTPPGTLGTFYDGTQISIPIEITDTDPDERVKFSILTGELPPGVFLDPRTGLISGLVLPLIGPPGTAPAGYDASRFAEYPFDFSTRSASKNFQFTVEISDGKESNIRTFEIFVYARNTMSADTTDYTADNTFITADVSPTRTPMLLTPAGFLGRVRADNFYAFQFSAIDFDGDPIEYLITTGSGIGYDEGLFDENGIGFDRGSFSLPPGLQLNAATGWLYGYIPDQGATEATYRFAIRVRKLNDPTVISDFYYFTLTITGDIETEIEWLTPSDLGTINNGAISTLAVEAINVGGRALTYRLAPGTPSRLPQGLSVMPSGHIVGRVSFNTFAMDGGATTFDKDLNTRLDIDETTFDMVYRFTINAYAPQTEQLGYQVGTIRVINGGSGYTGQPVITLSPPPNTADSIQATAGLATIVNGVITEIAVGNPGRGYVTPPTVTISGGGGVGATANALVVEADLINAVSVFKEFTVTLVRAFNEPYETLYIKAMPPHEDRDLLNQLLLNQDVIPAQYLYRSDDPNFGLSDSVIYNHAFGLTASTLEEYIEAMQLNTYWKTLTLGEIKTARALDNNGNVLYEVVYSQIIDDLVNNQGQSISEIVQLPYPVENYQDQTVTQVYPNSLDNMRNRVIDRVGQISPALPGWMISKQENGRVLGFVPAWVICYTVPGRAKEIVYKIQQQFGNQLNKIDFEVDRYELDRSQTINWDSVTDSWIPSPPSATTFDRLDRPTALVDRGTVDYATTLAYSQINWQTLNTIATAGGVDGAFTRAALNGKTLIFIKQENFDGLTDDEAFTDYLVPYDNAGFSRDDTIYDESVVIPGQLAPINRRLSVYQMSVTEDNFVRLTEVLQTTTNDLVYIRLGSSYANNEFYVAAAPPPGGLVKTWAVIPPNPGFETIFDGNATKFVSPADRWTATDEFDKYLAFPKRTILG